jgi:hypothetical protein
MTIHTPASLRKTQRRLDRRIQSRQAVLAVLRRGAVLHRHHASGSRVVWSLSTGTFIAPEIAVDILNDAHVVGVGDALGPWGSSSNF